MSATTITAPSRAKRTIAAGHLLRQAMEFVETGDYPEEVHQKLDELDGRLAECQTFFLDVSSREYFDSYVDVAGWLLDSAEAD